MHARVNLLDGVKLTVDERIYDHSRLGRRQGRLLSALAHQVGRPVDRETLADVLWDGAPPQTWRPNLRTAVSGLRQLLGGAVISTPEGYMLDLPPEAVDIERLRRDAARADHVDAAAVRSLFAAYDDGGGGIPLRGLTGPWADAARAELDAVRRRLLTRVAWAELELGHAREAARHAAELIDRQPLLEDGYRLLMRAHAAAGNLGEALRAYEQCRQVLGDELGTDPSPLTQRVFLGLLRGSAVDVAKEQEAPDSRRIRLASTAASAAAVAFRAGIYEEAAREAARGLAALDAMPVADPVMRRRLIMALASARRHLGDPEGRRSLERLVAEAREQGDDEAWVSALLSLTGGGAASDEAYVDDTLLDAYRLALESAVPDDPRLRARLTGHLATALAWRQDGATGRATAREAVEDARATNDRTVILAALWSRRQVVGGSLDLELQRDLDTEMLKLAEELGDDTGRTQALVHGFVTSVEAGEGGQLESLIEKAEEAAAAAGGAPLRHTVGYTRAGLTMMRGDLVGAAVEIDAAASEGRRAGLEAPLIEAIRLTQMTSLWIHSDRFARHAREVAEFFGGAGLPEWAGMAARAHLELGEVDKARSSARTFVDNFIAVGPTIICPVSLAAWLAPVLARLGDIETAARLYPCLQPHAGLGGYFGHFSGPIDTELAVLALALDESEQAAAYARSGADFAHRLRAPLHEDRARRILASAEQLRS